MYLQMDDDDVAETVIYFSAVISQTSTHFYLFSKLDVWSQQKNIGD